MAAAVFEFQFGRLARPHLDFPQHTPPLIQPHSLREHHGAPRVGDRQIGARQQEAERTLPGERLGRRHVNQFHRETHKPRRRQDTFFEWHIDAGAGSAGQVRLPLRNPRHDQARLRRQIDLHILLGPVAHLINDLRHHAAVRAIEDRVKGRVNQRLADGKLGHRDQVNPRLPEVGPQPIGIDRRRGQQAARLVRQVGQRHRLQTGALQFQDNGLATAGNCQRPAAVSRSGHTERRQRHATGGRARRLERDGQPRPLADRAAKKNADPVSQSLHLADVGAGDLDAVGPRGEREGQFLGLAAP